jgi:hypothetical protein
MYHLFAALNVYIRCHHTFFFHFRPKPLAGTEVKILLASIQDTSNFKLNENDELVEIQTIFNLDGYKVAEEQLLENTQISSRTLLFPTNPIYDASFDQSTKIYIPYARNKTQQIGNWITQTSKPMVILLPPQTG